jgi:hypothetical protein
MMPATEAEERAKEKAEARKRKSKAEKRITKVFNPQVKDARGRKRSKHCFCDDDERVYEEKLLLKRVNYELGVKKVSLSTTVFIN